MQKAFRISCRMIAAQHAFEMIPMPDAKPQAEWEVASVF